MISISERVKRARNAKRFANKTERKTFRAAIKRHYKKGLTGAALVSILKTEGFKKPDGYALDYAFVMNQKNCAKIKGKSRRLAAKARRVVAKVVEPLETRVPTSPFTLIDHVKVVLSWNHLNDVVRTRLVEVLLSGK